MESLEGRKGRAHTRTDGGTHASMHIRKNSCMQARTHACPYSYMHSCTHAHTPFKVLLKCAFIIGEGSTRLPTRLHACTHARTPLEVFLSCAFIIGECNTCMHARLPLKVLLRRAFSPLHITLSLGNLLACPFGSKNVLGSLAAASNPISQKRH